MQSPSRPSTAFIHYVCIATVLAGYFAYAAVRGDLGVMKRLVISADALKLEDQRADLQKAVDQLQNKTRRLSDQYLDLDLLDEQARKVLGMMRSDEVVIRENTPSDR